MIFDQLCDLTASFNRKQLTAVACISNNLQHPKYLAKLIKFKTLYDSKIQKENGTQI